MKRAVCLLARLPLTAARHGRAENREEPRPNYQAKISGALRQDPCVGRASGLDHEMAPSNHGSPFFVKPTRGRDTPLLQAVWRGVLKT